MTIRQRKLFTSTEFEFGPDRLRYTFRTLSGSKQLSIDYAEISVDTKRIEERHASYLYVGLILFGVGSLLGAFIYSTEDRLSGFNYAIIGAIFLIAFFIQKKKFVVLAAGTDPLIVLGDERESEILSRIEKHRKERFIALLQRPDFVADELKREGLISWLLERQVLSEAEIRALSHGTEGQESGPQLH